MICDRVLHMIIFLIATTSSTDTDRKCRRYEMTSSPIKKSVGNTDRVMVRCDGRKLTQLTSAFLHETLVGPPTPVEVQADVEVGTGILHDEPRTTSTEPIYQLNLQNADLETIQDGVFRTVPTLEVLNLRMNKVKEIGKRTFEGLLGLKDLNLGRNEIETVEPFSFSQQNELVYLTLAENHLEELSYFTFRGLTRSQYLNLELNNITVLRAGTFAAMPNLENLRLSLNRIRKLDGGMLAGLYRLKHLYFTSNNLERILDGAFRSNKRLESLDLSGNQLTTINSATFDGLKNLRRLSLSNNKIVHIDDVAFQKMPLLRELDLSHNEMKTLSRGMFMGLVNLNYFYAESNQLGETGSLSKETDSYQRLTEALSLLCRKRGMHFVNLRNNGLSTYLKEVDPNHFGYDITDPARHLCSF